MAGKSVLRWWGRQWCIWEVPFNSGCLLLLPAIAWTACCCSLSCVPSPSRCKALPTNNPPPDLPGAAWRTCCALSCAPAPSTPAWTWAAWHVCWTSEHLTVLIACGLDIRMPAADGCFVAAIAATAARGAGLSAAQAVQHADSCNRLPCCPCAGTPSWTRPATTEACTRASRQRCGACVAVPAAPGC